MIGEVDPTIINLTVFVLRGVCGLSRRMERNAGTAYAADVGDQCDFRNYPGRCDAGGRSCGNRLGRVAWGGSRDTGRDQCIRRISRHAADA